MLPADAGTLAMLVALGAGIFVTGGVVKGTLGVGLPLVCLPMLSLLVTAPRAMGMLVAPVLLSNLWQAWRAGKLHHLRRFGGLLAAQLVVTVLTVHFSQDLSAKAFNVLLALAVLGAVALMALRPSGTITPRQERWASPVAGVVAGVIGGISSVTGPVLITYLVALRLTRDEFVGAISLLYFLAAVPMYGSMLWWNRFDWLDVGWSVLALIPMFLGMRIGTAIRHRLSENLFRRLLFVFLCLLALLLLVK